MLRALVLALLLLNAAYLAWTQGLLAAYGWAPATQAEPERLAQQIQPEVMQLQGASVTIRPPVQALVDSAGPASQPAAPAANSSPAAATAPPAAAPVASAAPTTPAAATGTAAAAPEAAPPPPPALSTCLQAGLFTEQQARALHARLNASLPAGSWSFENYAEPVRWSIYMGKYISQQALNRKRAMLRQLGVTFETPASPLLNPGLTLGNFNTKAEAEAALAQLATDHGVRSAKIVLEHPELATQWLRLPAVDEAWRSKVQTLVPQITGLPLQACN